jgi:flagellar biosynthesis protein FliQ
MESTEIFQISREALYTLLLISAPVMLTAMVVGLVISLFQAVTQIQETTLTFVPKILAVFLALAFSMPLIIGSLTDLNNRIYERIVHID